VEASPNMSRQNSRPSYDRPATYIVTQSRGALTHEDPEEAFIG